MKPIENLWEKLIEKKLISTNNFLGVPGTRLINFSKTKGYVELGATQCFSPLDKEPCDLTIVFFFI